jgi:hypothetical protein
MSLPSQFSLPESIFKDLVWSENKASNAACSYTHCQSIGTPIGRFFITWKSWKEYPGYTIDEFPWGDGSYASFDSLEEAKAECELVWINKLKECLK